MKDWPMKEWQKIILGKAKLDEDFDWKFFRIGKNKMEGEQLAKDGSSRAVFEILHSGKEDDLTGITFKLMIYDECANFTESDWEKMEKALKNEKNS